MPPSKRGVVGAAPSVRQVVDLLCLAYRGMVLPQHEHRVGVIGETRSEGERTVEPVVSTPMPMMLSRCAAHRAEESSRQARSRLSV